MEISKEELIKAIMESSTEEEFMDTLIREAKKETNNDLRECADREFVNFMKEDKKLRIDEDVHDQFPKLKHYTYDPLAENATAIGEIASSSPMDDQYLDEAMHDVKHLIECSYRAGYHAGAIDMFLNLGINGALNTEKLKYDPPKFLL